MPHTITPAGLDDFPQLHRTFMAILAEGQTYSYAEEDFTVEDVYKYWMGAHTHCFVARSDDGAVAGAVALRPNRTGRGAHIANASFMVGEAWRGQGIAKAMAAKMLEQARALGFKGIQFNFVVSTNTVAVSLWQKVGFRIIGTVPDGFRHQTRGLVDVHIMYLGL